MFCSRFNMIYKGNNKIIKIIVYAMYRIAVVTYICKYDIIVKLRNKVRHTYFFVLKFNMWVFHECCIVLHFRKFDLIQKQVYIIKKSFNLTWLM